MRKYSLLLVLLLNVSLGHGQYSIPFQDVKAPEILSFERYGNLSISEYTGRPNISIPIHTIENGDIKIPLTINYNTNGILVQEEASQFGLGWYFGTGMVTHTKNGKNDLFQNVWVEQPDYFSGTMGFVVDPPTNVLLRTPSIPSDDLNQYFVGRIKTYGLVGDRYDCFTALQFDGGFYYSKNNIRKNYSNIINSNLNEDFEIDYFNANFFGHQIKFFINPRQNQNAPFTFSVLNNEKYKIEYINNSWIITDPSGLKYYFEKKELNSNSLYGLNEVPSYANNTTDYRHFAVPYTSPTNNYDTNNWKITKIKDTKGNEVNFNYEDLLAAATLSSSQEYEISKVSKFCDSMGGDTNETFLQNGPLPPNYITGNEDNTIKTWINRNPSTNFKENSILTEISFSDTKIIFTNNDRIDSPFDKRVDNIQVSYKNNFIKKILFSYDYFNAATNDNLQKRLKLNTIRIGEKLYQFEYNPIDLPNKNSFSSDYWGYYNGMPNTTVISNPFRLYKDLSTIPSWAKPEMPNLEGIANRSAHPQYCKAGMLEKIIYPTGGYTTFEYELNEFDNIFFPNHDNRIGVDSNNNYIQNYTQTTSKGFGLRIKSTTDFIDSNHFIKKKYTYSIGKHITPFVGYFQKNNVHYEESYNPNFLPTSSLYNICYYDVQTIKSFNTSYFQNNVIGNGNSVGYDKVTIEEEDIQGKSNGKTVLYFTNIPDNSPITTFDNGYASSINYDLENFMKLGFSIRNSNLDNGLLLSKEVYDNSSHLKRKSEYQYEFKMLPNSVKFNTRLIPTTTTHKYKNVFCFIGVFDTFTKYFTWQEYLLFYYPLKLPKSRLKFEKNTDYYGTESITDITSYAYDNYDNLMYKETKDNFGDQIFAEFNMFSANESQAQKNIFTLPKVKISYIKGLVSTTQNYFYNDNIYPKLTKVESYFKGNTFNKYNTHYNIYDDKGNVLEYCNENGKFNCIIWGYNQTKPIAKIENCKYNDLNTELINQVQIASNNSLTGLEPSLISSLSLLRSLFPNSMVTTYTYIPLIGVSTVTDPKGQITTYEYDDFGRLKLVKDHLGNVLSENEYYYRTQN